MRKVLSGPFTVTADGAAAWTLRGAATPQRVVHLGALRPASGAVLPSLPASTDLRTVTIDWSAAGVAEVRMQFADQLLVVAAAAVRVHEPLPDLYRALPLAEFDAAARAFWRKVFLLVRVPGGRFLLQAWARRARTSR